MERPPPYTIRDRNLGGGLTFMGSFLAWIALSVAKGIALLLSYISGNAFPQPLSEAEEKNTWRGGRRGIRKPEIYL